MRRSERKEVTLTQDTVVGVTCDFCGEECEPDSRINGRQYFQVNDGFEFKYRDGEEDDIWMRADDMCDKCMFEDDRMAAIQDKVQAAMEMLHEAAPFARVYAPLWEFSFATVDNETINE